MEWFMLVKQNPDGKNINCAVLGIIKNIYIPSFACISENCLLETASSSPDSKITF